MSPACLFFCGSPLCCLISFLFYTQVLTGLTGPFIVNAGSLEKKIDLQLFVCVAFVMTHMRTYYDSYAAMLFPVFIVCTV